MTGPGPSAIQRRGWAGAILWSLLVVLSIQLMVRGLSISTLVLFGPDPVSDEETRVGNLHILGGSAASLAAALLSWRRGHPHWVTVCVAAPALHVGGVAVLMPQGLARHLAALAALPAAIAGITGGLVDHGYRRVRLQHPVA